MEDSHSDTPQPPGPFLMFLLHHPLLNMPALSPTPCSTHPPPVAPISTPSACLSSAAARRKFIAAPDCCGQILIKCCFAAICLIGHRRDVMSTCSLCLRPPARLTDALSSLHRASLAVNGTVGRRERGERSQNKPTSTYFYSTLLSPFTHKPQGPCDQPELPGFKSHQFFSLAV